MLQFLFDFEALKKNKKISSELRNNCSKSISRRWKKGGKKANFTVQVFFGITIGGGGGGSCSSCSGNPITSSQLYYFILFY